MFHCNNIYRIFADTMNKIIFTAIALVLSLCVNAQDLQVPTDSATRSLEEEALSLFEQKNYGQALIRYESAAIMRQKMNIPKDTMYKKDLLFQGKCYFRLKRIEEAVNRAQKLADYYAANFSNSDRDYAFYIDNLALYQGAAGNFVDAEKNSREAVNIYEKLMKNDFDLAIILEHLAENCDGNGKPSEAVNHEIRALNILKTIYGEHSDEYLDEIVYLKRYYEDSNNVDKAQKLQETIDRLKKESEVTNIKIPEMFATSERCRLYNSSVLSGAKQYLDCNLKKTNVSEISEAILLWTKTSTDITVEVDSTMASFLGNTDYLPFFVAFMAAATEYSLENHLKEIDATGLKLIKQRVDGFYRRNKSALKKCRKFEKWLKE
jgi:tetratricopeptide (TPR) repeat protein